MEKSSFLIQSKFNLFGSDSRQLVRRPIGTRNNIKYQILTVKRSGGSAMVWGIFYAQGVGLLVEINGNMNATIYKDNSENNLSYAEKTMPQTNASESEISVGQ